MKMSDIIADFIGEMLSDNGGVAEVQRKSLADRFSCVPSQINYVIETRFTPEHGYLVESQRGGGGYIRIVRLMDDKQRTLLEAARGIGGRLTQNDAARLTRTFVSAGLLTHAKGSCFCPPVRTEHWPKSIKPTGTVCELPSSDARSWNRDHMMPGLRLPSREPKNQSTKSPFYI